MRKTLRFALLAFVATLTACGGDASDPASGGSPSPAPGVTLSASPASVSAGAVSTLTWSSTNATACTASGAWSGTKSVNGSESTAALNANSSFTLTCTGAGGSGQASTSVAVTAAPPAPTVTLSATPTSVASGGSSSLTWSSTNATACTASGSWTGAKATTGTQSTGALTANATYTLSCTGAGGTTMATAAVTVTANTPMPTVALSASPTSVSSGGSSTLTWSSTNATSCSASGSWSGTKATSGTQSTGALTANATYNLSCTGAGGTAQATATVTVTASTPAPTVTLTASPTSVASGGSSTLTWSSTNATSCTASGGWSGTKATAGTQSTGALTTATTFTLSCTGAGGTKQASVTVSLIGATTTFPLHVEAGKRYLLDAQNRPFLMTGDSPWSLIAELKDADVDTYLETRRQQGFNTILVELIEHHFSDNPPNNANGDAPFTTPGDFSTPNEAYFAHAADVISKANDKGFLVLLAPAYEGFQGGDEGWYSEMQANGVTKLRAYGQYVANRFKNFDNILWVQGGDYNAPDKTLARAVANGIRDVDTTGKWLQTFHGARGTAALEFLNTTSDPWLTMNDIYTDAGSVVSEANGQYAGSTMPFFLIESGYENNDVDGAGARAQAYQAVLSGATGQMMGNFPVWYLGAGWQAALTSTGTYNGGATMGHLPELFSLIEWQNLVPDSNGSVLTSSPGSGIDRVVAARVNDGSAVLAYTHVSQSLSIDMTKLAGPNVNARWFNTSTGAFTTVSGAPFANTGNRSFASPGGSAGYVLVLQSQP